MLPTPTPTSSTSTASPSGVEGKLVTPADIPSSTADIPATSGMLVALQNKGLNVSACLKWNGITQAVQNTVGVDVTQPSSMPAGE